MNAKSTLWLTELPRLPRYGLCSNTTGTLMPWLSVSPGRLMRMRMRSRAPSSSVSSGVSTKTTSSIALAKANCGCVAPFSTLSHGGGCSFAAAAGAAMATNAAMVANAVQRDFIEPLPWSTRHKLPLR